MNRTKQLAVSCTFGIALLASISASAQNSTDIKVDRFEPLPSQGANILGVAKSDVLPHGNASAGFVLHYADDLLGIIGDDGEIATRLVAHQLTADMWFAIGLGDFFDLGFVVPLVISQSSDPLTLIGRNDELEGVALRDFRIVPKLRIVDPGDNGIGLAVVPSISIATGGRLFNTDGDITFEPRAVVDYRNSGFQIALNAAYLWRPQRILTSFVSDDVVRWGAGLQIPVGYEPLKVIATGTGDIGLVEDQDDERDNPTEILGGLQYMRDGFVAQLGGGAGVTDGVGAPDFRVFGTFGYTPLNADPDGDGVKGSADECPKIPEDIDGFEDTDGCPDNDNDGDGIDDANDNCPDLPEDIDGFEDTDGCEDTDNDGDGIKDADDKCPDEAGVAEENGCPYRDKDGDGVFDDVDKCVDKAEDKDGFQDEDGCPDEDNDADGIFDDKDKCPDSAEDKDGFEDGDGCPEADNDKDGILDAKDQCPNEPEVINGVKDEDGCPDKGKSKVRITKTKIEILEKVYFDSGKATIKKRSFNLLNQVGAILRANPQITKIQIEGHTDDRGKDASNLKLSEGRAGAVRDYLVSTGIPIARLLAKGFGESKPIADNKKSSGRSQNRRVEFNILEVDGKPIGDGPAVIEKKEVIKESAPTTQPTEKTPAPADKKQ